jgi:import receptor subunit TOM20
VSLPLNYVLIKLNLNNYKEREKALKKRETAQNGSIELPDLRDYEAVQKFFIQEVQLGEELLATGIHYFVI